MRKTRVKRLLLDYVLPAVAGLGLLLVVGFGGSLFHDEHEEAAHEREMWNMLKPAGGTNGR